MHILYIVNMKEEKLGGLFKATYERIVRHHTQATSYIENINYYDSRMIAWLKESIIKKEALSKTRDEYQYQSLRINNLNFVRGFAYYLNKIFNREQNILDAMVNTFIQKNKKEIKEADLIHAHWGYPNGYIAYQVSKQYDLPYFITFHGSDLNNIREKELVFLLEAMEHAEKCFFVSQELLNHALTKGYSGSNAEVTYNGVDIEQFTIPNQPIKREKVVGYIGALESIKGADLLPEIFSNIQNKTEEPIHFQIIGEGSLKKAMEQGVRERNLKVQFTGNIEFENVPDQLADVDVLVVPSRKEGLGMVILEANAMGIPAVGTKVGGIPEAIGYTDNLIELNQEMTINMAQRVAELLANNQKDAQKYRNHVKKSFSWEDTVATEWENYLKTVKNS